eukprot:1160581-Rhodomonas_salina.1
MRVGTRLPPRGGARRKHPGLHEGAARVSLPPASSSTPLPRASFAPPPPSASMPLPVPVHPHRLEQLSHPRTTAKQSSYKSRGARAEAV